MSLYEIIVFNLHGSGGGGGGGCCTGSAAGLTGLLVVLGNEWYPPFCSMYIPEYPPLLSPPYSSCQAVAAG